MKAFDGLQRYRGKSERLKCKIKDVPRFGEGEKE